MTQTAHAIFQPFELEHYQSLFERTVELNLADSSVQCLTTREWLTPDEQQTLLDTPLYYPEVNGTRELRARIAALYPGASPDHVLVTVGAAQANSLIASTLIAPGDEVAIMSPGYRQLWGLAKGIGCDVVDVPLREACGWRIDLDELDAIITSRTRLVSVVNPGNPTGTILTNEEMTRIVAACARVGAWLHADEVYIGTEHDARVETPSFWGRYDRLVCVNSLSKAYGLAGVRIGWVVADPATIDAMWRRHEYSVIAAAAPSMALAAFALAPPKRQQLLDRQRAVTRAGRAVLDEWLARNPLFSVGPSAATAIAFVRYALDLGSREFADQIRERGSVLVAPGEYLGADRHLRITVGYEPQKVRTALERITGVVSSLPLPSA